MLLFNQERSNNMHITCFNCKNTWEVSAAHILGAKLKYGLGFHEHTFVCPNCQAKNVLSKAEFESAMSGSAQIPVTGGHPQPDTRTETHTERPHPGVLGRSAPVNPVVGPGPSSRQRHGVVRVRSLHVRRDHSTRAETMAGLRRGERITILNTWTDGENTWAQLGPERWAAIEYNGEALIDLTDD
jgi:hypothetical protein